MKLDLICNGLKILLINNHYNPTTIAFYEREWKKIEFFLLEEYNRDDFNMERGLAYLEKQYGIVTKCQEGTLPQQRVQLIRVVNMLVDYQLHGVLTKRYLASKNQIELNDYFQKTLTDFEMDINLTDLSKSTKNHYTRITKIFLDYLQQKENRNLSAIDLLVCNDFIKTFSEMSFKTIEQRICGLRYFLRYLFHQQVINSNVAEKIHMPKISKQAKIPSTWTKEELKKLLSVIDRNSPIGKRDYAMILIACILGLRIGDIKRLTFDNFNWEEKKITFIQQKTHNPLTLALPDAVGWAVIDYIKNGRPQYFETEIIFIKHMPPFDPFPDSSHLTESIYKYMNKAGISLDKNCHRGFHSLRHTAASMLLESDTQLPVISTILGHSSVDITSIYLKTDLKKLKECVLDLEFENDIKFNI